MNTESLDAIRNLLPPQGTVACSCQLCRTGPTGCRPEDAKSILMTAGELRAALDDLPENASVVAEMYVDNEPHVALIRCVYRDMDAPTVVLIATEETPNKNMYV